MRRISDVQSSSSAGPLNPLVALQSLVSSDIVSTKQRIKAAQQLEEYLRALSPTPDWITRNTQLGNEPWLVQWSYALVLQTEERVPRKTRYDKSDGQWDDTSMEMKDFDRVVTQVMLMWRTLLDHTEDAALVDQLVKYLQDLLKQQAGADQWKLFVLKKLQTHFVDIADVLTGWMMSTGPRSMLREEILSLLREFDRLWADNSVFSLQLIQSFADEIVNLCDSWKDRQESDDDRLCTLLVCFMMVSQCVPDLALAAKEGIESPFVRVLHRVVSCPQLEVTLFCLINCSEYLVEMSNCKHSSFASLSISAVRFLLYHCAVQSQMHDSEVDTLCKVIENVSKLASTNFCSIEDPLLVQATAIGSLEDDMPLKFVKKGSPPKRLRTMQYLFQLRLPSGVTHITQLCLQLVRLGGIGAFKVLGAQVFQCLDDRHRDKDTSYFVFAATCFILASRNVRTLICTDGKDKAPILAILELLSAKLTKQDYRNCQHRLTLRQLCLVLKMVSAFLSAVSHLDVCQNNVAKIVNGVLLQMLGCALSLLTSKKAKVLDYRATINLLKVIDAVLSETKLVSVLPLKVCRRVVKAINVFVYCSSVKVREECLQVMHTLTSRAEARQFACNMLGVLLDQALDHRIRDKGVSFTISDIARWALLNQEEVRASNHLSQDSHVSITAADFENIMNLFQTYDCDAAQWNRVCKRIVDRTAQGKAIRNADVFLNTVRQAAGWCIKHRLRTHFGGPAQSFESIERLLQEYSNRVQNVSGLTSQRSDAQLLSTWLLLEFMIALEMSMTRAVCSIEDDQSSPESEDHKSALFFRTNKAVCEDWLTRIRPFLVEMSRNGSSNDLCRYHSHAMMTTCYRKLSRVMTSLTSHGVSEQACNELTQAEQDMDAALFSLCRCHVDAKDADSVFGFQRWSDSVSTAISNWYHLKREVMDVKKEQLEVPLFRWVSAMRYEAQMRYEDAAAEYEGILQPLLADVDTSSSRVVSAATILESPIQYLRISLHTLLGCVKHCAKCYASLGEWTKLRSFVSQFIHIARSLMDHDYSSEKAHAIFSCYDTWSNEVEHIRSLESEVSLLAADAASEGKLKVDMKNRAAMALRVWSIFGSAVDALPVLDLDNVASQLASELIPLALQPSPWNGYTGENTSKRTEDILCRMSGCSQMVQLIDMQQADMPTEGLRLNHEMYDSAVWSQPFCTPRLNYSSHDKEAGSADAHCLHLMSVARLTRKQYNYAFAQKLLKEAATVKDASKQSLMAVNYEKAKLLETIGMEDDGRRLLETQCEIGLSSTRFANGLENATARSFLYLAKILGKADSTKALSPSTSSVIQNTLMSITNCGKQDLLTDQNDLDFLPQPQDAAVYKCHFAAIAVSSRSAKSWIRYSHWCYQQGKQTIARITEQDGYIHLDSSDEANVHGLLDEIGITESDRDLIFRAFCHILENGELIGQRLDFFHQLCTERAPGHNSEAANRLFQLQQLCHANVLRFLKLSAYGYGEYLTVLFSDQNSSVPKQEVTMVALRLLHLLTTYGAENDMMSSLKAVFANGPVTPWSYVVPQLIARAHHPVAAVSAMICLVFKRLAHHSPHAIVYPTVMDSMEAHVEEQGATNMLAAILLELQNVSSEQVEGVRLLISELRRISVLWDEAWISVLMELAADVARRSSTLEKEATRVNKNVSLSADDKVELAHRKLVAIMKPTLVPLERLWYETCGRACGQHNVSSHERKFLKEYGGLIEKALESFRHYCSSEVREEGIKTPQDLWQPFAEIMKALINATARKDQLSLYDISPAISSASREIVTTNMPGVFVSGETDPITIYRVKPNVTVLRTKTKPKSLEIVGSDGKTYKYLLKAREDLRLDERIQQFLRVTNDFLRADVSAAARDLLAQNYSVIPLSKNAGLIQMVSNVVPLFQVHVSRNEHDTATNGRVSHDPIAASLAQQQPPPPTAQFYAKLKQHGIANVSPSNRAQWPIPVLKQVYLELIAQRPRNVLLQEISHHSEDLRESWTKSMRFSKSLAVMSLLGFIIGLGDRHLDNILLCVNSGDIVHIDYNVCFEKGRTLKVPEIVPFRLTPMLQDALGLTGVEGKFRVAFETTLRVVRSDDVREALLTLFEAFVYSPLVDWTCVDKRQGRSGDLKDRLEVNVNLSLFLSRAEERRQDTITFGRQYEQFADTITQILDEIKVPLVDLLEQHKRVQFFEQEEQMLLTQVSKLEAEMCAYQKAQNLDYASTEAATAQAKEMSAKVAAFANECFAKHQQVEKWRQKSINFSETDFEAQLNAVTNAIDVASFREAHARLSNIVAQSQYGCQQEEMVAALETQCQSLDTKVKRLRDEMKKIATSLIPYMSSYSHWRKEIDAYLDVECKVSVKNVYLDWWDRCTECLRGLVPGADVETTDIVKNVPFTPCQLNLDCSNLILNRLNEEDLSFSMSTDQLKEDSSYFLQADQLLYNVWNALSAMKLSNGQGQRLMELAGASWIIDVMERLGSCLNTNAAETCTFTPVLAAPLEFQHIVAVSYACSTLLELVSTPKGSMKRLRGYELLTEIHDNNSNEHNQRAKENVQVFIDALQAVGSFAVVLDEELISNFNGRQWNQDVCHDVLRYIREMSGGMQSLIDTLLMPSAVNDDNYSMRILFQEHPAIQNVIAAAQKVTQELSAVTDLLQQGSVLTDEEAERIKSSSSSSWINVVLKFITLLSVDKASQKVENEIRAVWSDHMNVFLSSCVIKLLRYLLSSVISFEWKFDFCALLADKNSDSNNEEQATLTSRWFVFSCSQIADILPSTLPYDTPEIHISTVTQSVATLMTVFEEWWSQKWRMYQSELWNKTISSLRTRHVRRLRYAAWLGATPIASVDFAGEQSLNRAQLLQFLSTQVPHLNALLTDQSAVEVDALELAKQLDHLASKLGPTFPDDRQFTSENLHGCVQMSYTNAAALFDYGRRLADLVQGICVIETSSGDFVQEVGQVEQVELEVNTIGKNLLQKALEVTVKLQACSNAVSEVNARTRALQDEIERNHALYNATALSRQATKTAFIELWSQKKGAVMDASRMLWKQVKEMRLLLRSFDKLKTPLKKQTMLAESENARSERQLQAEKNNSLSETCLSPTSTVGYSFVENDRLVKILLRSIRSVKHLQLLERVLERHGEACTQSRQTIGQIDQALAEFETRADQVLLDESQDKASADPNADAVLTLLLDVIKALGGIAKDSQPLSEGSSATVEYTAETSLPLLVVGRDLVRECVKLFFEATKMADRLSSAEDESHKTGEDVLTQHIYDGDDEQHTTTDNFGAPIAMASSNSVVVGVCGDSGDSSHDTNANSSCGVEKKSQYGLQVLKRIEEKLLGMETAHAPIALTVEQQTSWLIDEATKTDNLCIMYEGWTPWI